MDSDKKFALSSPAFAEGGEIPVRYSCKGENFSPPLTISGVPKGTARLVLVMHDPDAPNGDFLHWTLWHLNPDVRVIPENTIPDDAVQGMNSAGTVGYMGPCPPSGTHHYTFNLYALDATMNLPEGTRSDELMQAIDNHVVAQTALSGTFSA